MPPVEVVKSEHEQLVETQDLNQINQSHLLEILGEVNQKIQAGLNLIQELLDDILSEDVRLDSILVEKINGFEKGDEVFHSNII